MAKFLSVIYILLSVQLAVGQSEPKILEGDFALSDKMQVRAVRRYEKVDRMSSGGDRRFQVLKAEGYVCRALTTLRWICSKEFSQEPLTPYLVQELQKKWSGLLISLRTPAADPVLIRDDEGLNVWTVAQKTILRTSQASEPRVWENVTYLNVFNGERSKWVLYFGNYRDLDSPSMNLVDQETLSVQDVVEVVTENVTSKYFVDLFISRIQ